MLPCKNQEICTGCGACAAVCPVKCIVLQPNDEGFLCPVANTDACTDCGKCRQICPVNPEVIYEKKKVSDCCESRPVGIYAAWHLDERVRYESSSGGVFTALAENILVQGGVVVGAAFDDRLVVRHILVESSKDLCRLRGSKYVQSKLDPALYQRIYDMLKQNRPILFSGTPCQVAGLRSFLCRPYEKLICCDMVCHGVPSPLLLECYVTFRSIKGNRLAKIDFRDKTAGWKDFGVRLYYQDGTSRLLSMWSDPYMSSFLQNYILRPACYQCKFKGSNYFGDLTIADFWGVEKKYSEYDRDDKGTSLVLINNEKGRDWLNTNSSNLFLGIADLNTAITGNPAIVRSCSRPPQRETFYVDLNNLSFAALVYKYRLYQPSFIQRVVSSIKRRIVSLLCLNRKNQK